MAVYFYEEKKEEKIRKLLIEKKSTLSFLRKSCEALRSGKLFQLLQNILSLVVLE